MGRLDEAIWMLLRAVEERHSRRRRGSCSCTRTRRRQTAEMHKQLTIRQLHPAMTRDLAANHGL